MKNDLQDIKIIDFIGDVHETPSDVELASISELYAALKRFSVNLETENTEDD